MNDHMFLSWKVGLKKSFITRVYKFCLVWPTDLYVAFIKRRLATAELNKLIAA